MRTHGKTKKVWVPQKHTVANEQVTTLQQQQLFLLKSCEKKKFKSEKGKERVGWFCGGGGGGDPRMRRKRIVESIVSRGKVLSRAAALRKKKRKEFLTAALSPEPKKTKALSRDIGTDTCTHKTYATHTHTQTRSWEEQGFSK